MIVYTLNAHRLRKICSYTACNAKTSSFLLAVASEIKFYDMNFPHLRE